MEGWVAYVIGGLLAMAALLHAASWALGRWVKGMVRKSLLPEPRYLPFDPRQMQCWPQIEACQMQLEELGFVHERDFEPQVSHEPTRGLKGGVRLFLHSTYPIYAEINAIEGEHEAYAKLEIPLPQVWLTLRSLLEDHDRVLYFLGTTNSPITTQGLFRFEGRMFGEVRPGSDPGTLLGNHLVYIEQLNTRYRARTASWADYFVGESVLQQLRLRALQGASMEALVEFAKDPFERVREPLIMMPR